MSKYRSKKEVVDGITFDSRREAKRYVELKWLERSGKIKDLKLQHRFLLQPSFKKDGKTIRAINYIADFTYFDIEKNKNIVEDVKGYKTDVYQLKRKLFEYMYPELTIIEVK